MKMNKILEIVQPKMVQAVLDGVFNMSHDRSDEENATAITGTFIRLASRKNLTELAVMLEEPANQNIRYLRYSQATGVFSVVEDTGMIDTTVYLF